MTLETVAVVTPHAAAISVMVILLFMFVLKTVNIFTFDVIILRFPEKSRCGKAFFSEKVSSDNFFCFSEFKQTVFLISEIPEDIVKRGILKAEIKEKMNETRGNLSF